MTLECPNIQGIFLFQQNEWDSFLFLGSSSDSKDSEEEQQPKTKKNARYVKKKSTKTAMVKVVPKSEKPDIKKPSPKKNSRK